MASSGGCSVPALGSVVKDLAVGDELFISYVDCNLPYSERRRILQNHYEFDCKCGRCQRERKEMARKAKGRR